MTIPRRTLAACATALTTAGALTATPPAGATTAPAAARAAVTDIREVVNRLPVQVHFIKHEDGTEFTVQPDSRWTGSMWVPWAGDDQEVEDKRIVMYYSNPYPATVTIFQDYWAPDNQVKWSLLGTYRQSWPVEGGAGGGRKRLVIVGNDHIVMENSG